MHKHEKKIVRGIMYVHMEYLYEEWRILRNAAFEMLNLFFIIQMND